MDCESRSIQRQRFDRDRSVQAIVSPDRMVELKGFGWPQLKSKLR
jgi:hypothetical protein